MNTKYPRSHDRAVLVKQKYRAHSAPNQAQPHYAFLIYGAVQLRRHGIGTVLRVAGNADRIPAEAFDPVMAALGLDVDQGTTQQALAIDKFGRCHSTLPPFHPMLSGRLWLRPFLRIGSEHLRNGRKMLDCMGGWFDCIRGITRASLSVLSRQRVTNSRRSVSWATGSLLAAVIL
jgi:hypothetical protein